MRLVNRQKRDRHGSGLYRVTACFDAGSCVKNPAKYAICKTGFSLRESSWRTVEHIFESTVGYTPPYCFYFFTAFLAAVFALSQAAWFLAQASLAAFASFCASAFAVDFAWAHCVALFWQADLAFETT